MVSSAYHTFELVQKRIWFLFGRISIIFGSSDTLCLLTCSSGIMHAGDAYYMFSESWDHGLSKNITTYGQIRIFSIWETFEFYGGESSKVPRKIVDFLQFLYYFLYKIFSEKYSKILFVKLQKTSNSVCVCCYYVRPGMLYPPVSHYIFTINVMAKTYGCSESLMQK